MLRKLFQCSLLFGLLGIAGGITGCGMCQHCQDYAGPVPGSVNGHHYYNAPRSGSGIGGPPVVSGPMVQGSPTPAGTPATIPGTMQQGSTGR